jgi:hypothetical protein
VQAKSTGSEIGNPVRIERGAHDNPTSQIVCRRNGAGEVFFSAAAMTSCRKQQQDAVAGARSLLFTGPSREKYKLLPHHHHLHPQQIRLAHHRRRHFRLRDGLVQKQTIDWVVCMSIIFWRPITKSDHDFYLLLWCATYIFLN